MQFNDIHKIILSSARGIYIPRDFIESAEDWAKAYIDSECGKNTCDTLSSPDNEHYWDVWTEVLELTFTDPETGARINLLQDGDLWEIDLDQLEALTEEQQETYWETWE